jgi:hypothetical protein
MGYTIGGLGKNGQGIVSPLMPKIKSPRIGLVYDVVVASLPILSLATNKEVLFVTGGVQNNFIVEKSTKYIDEMVVPNMPEAVEIIVDDTVVDILGCYTPESTPNPNPIALDHPTQNLVCYRHPHDRNRRNDTHDLKSLQKRRERQNPGPISTTRLYCGWID